MFAFSKFSCKIRCFSKTFDVNFVLFKLCCVVVVVITFLFLGMEARSEPVIKIHTANLIKIRLRGMAFHFKPGMNANY